MNLAPVLKRGRWFLDGAIATAPAQPQLIALAVVTRDGGGSRGLALSDDE